MTSLEPGAKPGQPPPAPPPAAAGGGPDPRDRSGLPDRAELARQESWPRRALRSWRRWALWVLCAILLAVAVRAEEPMMVKSVHSLAHLRWGSLGPAILAETASMVALGVMEQRLLAMGGMQLATGRAIAIAYASNALSASLPVVGSGAATAYTYRRLVSEGATTTLAGWALILGGVVSNATFVLVISLGGIVSGNAAGVAAGLAGVVLTMAIVALAWAAVRRLAVRDWVARVAVWTLKRARPLIRRRSFDPETVVADALTGLGAFGVERRDVIYVTASALRNWTLDIVCLVFSLRAAGAHIPWWGIILAWAAGAGGSSLNLTPGGLGVVEAALTGALVALGVPGTRALAAVLVYRAITFWLAAAIGWLIYWLLRREHRAAENPAAGP